VLQSGPPQDVYLRPATPAVARQLGIPPINLIEAQRRAGRWHAADGTPLAPARDAAPERALLGVRPEHIAPTGGDSEAVIEVVEDTGPARIVLMRWAGRELHLVAPRSFAARPGDRLRPRIDAERVIVWPA